ncbi:MAG: MarR family transcriptional regulator [Fidelibacterota bacterium]|nr:MAG: MarR family transcriptional regulator [Candidatus Neomarinimicrobiota bacterium]
MNRTTNNQAEQLYQVFSALVKGYQFRDRNKVTSCGVSVTQCYTLEVLYDHGALTMSQLAGQLYLDVSTITRIMDQLVASKLVRRISDKQDRRVIRAEITRKGQNLVANIRSSLLGEYADILEQIPSSSRQSVIKAIELLLEAFKQRNRLNTGQSRAKPDDQR